ncbi:anti-phage defense ZorAB system protein ZorA [Methylicorpusculum oleiharenae]|uniref:anti-phage ZorAB system protein ZorA n=1 Tax=Methylicorpusculum oleiharenae TaxID=1338687 RepID=UPI00135AA60F|nr:anti-phage ZorAB system protein ZorA [Methylicorpusculum oleiharenae]MCD2451116.1 anti-phage defense ZorAB system protein ZorA [Methylicorpusculum oleiharenae]
MDLINAGNLKAYWHLWVLGSIIIVLIGYFLFKFLIPSYRLSKDLRQTIKKLRNLKSDGQAINVELIGKQIMTSQKLSHCWSEFAETLHPQSAADDMGQERVVRWRSTVPAEVFFNVETLVAIELKTEYFKHQPGILTGIGILGTFIGLLRGLSSFSVSSDPEKVRVSLDTLILGVREAFYMSAAAIGLAMFTTLVEKLCVTGRIKQVEDLCQLLDSLFEGGAGEEYLARLVKAGESSATQTAQLKDALVSDLKEMLTEMIRQQTEAIAGSFSESSKAQIVTTEQSGDRIAQAISDSLSEPLQKIASAVNTTTDTNGEAVTRVLNEVLITFSQQMKDMFGGQMGDISQLLQQTTTAMQSTVSRFDQLANNLDDAGKNAADVMSERLSIALESMETRQLTLNNTMVEFVNQLRDMVKTSQSETNDQLQQALEVMSEKICTLAGQLEQQANSAANNHKYQQEQLAQVASTLTNDLTAQVQSMIEQTNNAVSSMQATVASMREITKDNTQRMENSAGTLAIAADNFAQAGNSVSGVIQQTGTVSDKMATTSIALNNVASTVQTALNDYNNAGKAMSQMVEELKATVETAKNDASVSQSLVNQIKQSADHLLQRNVSMTLRHPVVLFSV